jgi:hypothetical protein
MFPMKMTKQMIFGPPVSSVRDTFSPTRPPPYPSNLSRGLKLGRRRTPRNDGSMVQKKSKVLQMCKMLRFYGWVVSICIVGFQRLTRNKTTVMLPSSTSWSQKSFFTSVTMAHIGSPFQNVYIHIF